MKLDMNNRLAYLSILCWGIMVLASSCTREPFDINDNNTPAGKVRLEMALNYVSDKQTVQTKGTPGTAAEDELTADRVWVLVFDNATTAEERKLKQLPAKAQLIEGGTIYANLNPESSGSWVYVLANVTPATSTYLASLPIETTLGDIMNSPQMRLAEATANGVANPFPMWGNTGAEIATINKGGAIQTVNLIRAVARIDVVVDPAILPANFTITSVSVVNAAKSGWLFTPDPVPAQRLTEVIKYTPATGVTNNAIAGQIYLYENNGQVGGTNVNVTRIIVEGHYGGKTSTSYYGVDIAYTPTGGTAEQFDIERNKIYTVNIRKINKDGYASYDLAESSSSYNSGMDTDVTVTDPYSHNIVSNGKQYMGVTNTHLLVYRKDNTNQTRNVLAATLAYTTDIGWTSGTMSAPAGITFVSSGTQSERLEVGSGSTPVIRDVLIHIAPTFTSGDIELRIGNLSQVIAVTNRRVTSQGGDIVDYFVIGAAGSSTDFTVAEVIEPSVDNAWLKVSDDVSALESSSLFDKITNPAGELYIHIAGNIAYNSTGATARKAQAFITSKNNEQRYRVHVEQNYLDVYSDANPIKPYTYAGTFHRWNETAERIIRIEADQIKYSEPGAVRINGTWIASVVYGDFIMLSTNPSNESAIISQDPYGESGVTSWSADQLEASGQFIPGEGRRVVTGEIDATTSNIYFKVGLTGRLSSFSAQPRYGLIALSYQSGTSIGSSVQFIYVRQGEEADYLMRPSDPVIYTAAYPSSLNSYRDPMATRPMSRKIAPFNLRAVASIADITNVALDQHQFVDYPSKGGDYYFAAGGYVAPRTASSGSINATSVPSISNWVPTVSETCPYGYRRISDNSSSGAIDLGVLRLSENRQSLWLFPMNHKELSNFSNQIKGYLADGYFDRRNIKSNESGSTAYSQLSKSYAHCVVRGAFDDREASYWGYLVFNPYNYASVFIPIAGEYTYNGFNTVYYQDEGAFGGILTSTRQSGNQWITNVGLIGGRDVFDNYQTTGRTDAYSVRCIRDEGEPIVGPTDAGVSVTPFTGGSGEELYEVRIICSGVSLQTQLEAAMGANITKVNSLRVVCNAGQSLSTADYLYLNTLAEASQILGVSTHSLHHLIIRGAGIVSIPMGAFTSSNWRSINIMEAKTIADGAFNLTTGSKLYNLSIGYFANDISIGAGAFTGTVDYGSVNLKIRGYALTQAAGVAWQGKTWKTITEYK